MKKIVVLAVLLTVEALTAPRHGFADTGWRVLELQPDKVFYIDDSSASCQAGVVTVSTLIDFAGVKYSITGKGYLSMIGDVVIDCARNLSAIGGGDDYSGNMGRGDVVHTDRSPSRMFMPIPGRSVMWRLRELLCAKSCAN
jgi:hypothetical protein